MLHFIETLSTCTLPSFATADNIIDHFNARLFDQTRIDEKRSKLHRVMTLMAAAAGTDVHDDDHDAWEDDLNDVHNDTVDAKPSLGA